MYVQCIYTCATLAITTCFKIASQKTTSRLEAPAVAVQLQLCSCSCIQLNPQLSLYICLCYCHCLLLQQSGVVHSSQKTHTHSCRRRRRQSTAVRSIRTVSACCFVARQGMMMLARWNVASGAYVKRLSVASLKFGCSIAHAAPMASQYLPCPSLTVPPAYESVSVQ